MKSSKNEFQVKSVRKCTKMQNKNYINIIKITQCNGFSIYGPAFWSTGEKNMKSHRNPRPYCHILTKSARIAQVKVLSKLPDAITTIEFHNIKVGNFNRVYRAIVMYGHNHHKNLNNSEIGRLVFFFLLLSIYYTLLTVRPKMIENLIRLFFFFFL